MSPRANITTIGVAKRLGYEVCWIERRRGQAGFGATPAPEDVAAPDYHCSAVAKLVAAVEQSV